jgi:hypothetical protein
MVTVIDPEVVLKLVGNPKIEEIAKEVRRKIEKALEGL